MRRLHRCLAALVLAPVAGCEPSDAPAAKAPAEERARSAWPVGETQLGGDWYVSSVNGAPMTREQITVRFADGLVRGQSGCVSMTWSYALAGGVLRTGPDPLQQPVCDRGRSGFETAFEDTFSSSPRAVLAADGSLEVAGAGGRVTLRRPGSPEPRETMLAGPIQDCPPNSQGEPPVQLVTVPSPAGAVRLLRTCSGGPMGMARNGGRLVLRDGCLELDHSPGQPLVWPAGTRLIAIPSTGELRVASEHGEPVRIGAYIGMAGAAGASARALAAVPQQCAGPGAFRVGPFHPCPDCATPSRPGVMPPPPPPIPPLPPPTPPPPRS